MGSAVASYGGLGIRNPEPPAECPPNARAYSAGSDWLTNETSPGKLWHRAAIPAKAAHDAWYLGQPFLGRPSKLGFGTKSVLDFAKAHSCPPQRHGEIEEHFVTPTGLPFRASPDVLGPLNQHLINTGPRNLGLAQHFDPRLAKETSCSEAKLGASIRGKSQKVYQYRLEPKSLARMKAIVLARKGPRAASILR
jgi:hypothetical protein